MKSTDSWITKQPGELAVGRRGGGGVDKPAGASPTSCNDPITLEQRHEIEGLTGKYLKALIKVSRSGRWARAPAP